MIVQSIPVVAVDISEFNARKNLIDGQADSGIEDLAASIERQGLLSPIVVYAHANGRYALIAGQRRLLAHRHLGREFIDAIVREESLNGGDATALSLVENLHRADMNPRDKAAAFRALLAQYGDERRVSRETGVSLQTVRKYLALDDLAPLLKDQLAAGETRSTQALAELARKFENAPEKQEDLWQRIGSFRQDVQQEIIRSVDTDLESLDELVEQAVEGRLGYRIVCRGGGRVPRGPTGSTGQERATRAGGTNRLRPHPGSGLGPRRPRYLLSSDRVSSEPQRPGALPAAQRR